MSMVEATGVRLALDGEGFITADPPLSDTRIVHLLKYWDDAVRRLLKGRTPQRIC
jgi:hypothetical protein